jgi:hypothetical protein
MLSVSEIRERLGLARETTAPAKEYKKLSRILFEDLLEYSAVPDDYIALIIEILSDPRHYQTRHAGLFLYELYTSVDAVSLDQRQQVLDALCKNYKYYDDDELCLLAGRFHCAHMLAIHCP